MRHLAAAIDALLPADAAPLVLLGPLALARHSPLGDREHFVVDDRTKPAKLRRRVTDCAIAVRANPRELPFRQQSISALVVTRLLGRGGDPTTTLVAWSRMLIDGGHLIVAERSSRLFGGGPRPETLTALLLNGGFAEIGQTWPASTGAVLTHGRRRCLPEPSAPAS